MRPARVTLGAMDQSCLQLPTRRTAPCIRWDRRAVLLASVFGPYAQDDQYGSRLINPMELFHNQVTRVQGPFSFRPSIGRGA